MVIIFGPSLAAVDAACCQAVAVHTVEIGGAVHYSRRLRHTAARTQIKNIFGWDKIALGGNAKTDS